MHLLARMTVSIRLICVVKMKRAYTLFMQTQILAHMHQFTTITVSICALLMHAHTYMHQLTGVTVLA